MNPRYTVSVAVYNNLNLTVRCLESVLRCSPPETEIIVTDNASTDATEEYLKSLGTRVGVLKNEKNVGFIAAHNKAAEYATGTYFVVLNNDCQVTTGWLEKLREPFKTDSGVGACGVKDGSCFSLDQEGYGVQANRLEYVEASCAMYPLSLVRKIGLFDSAYRFGYSEDADLSLRLRERGYKLSLVDMPMYHTRSATASMVRREGVDIDGFHAFNHAVLRNRWARYLERRSLHRSILLRRRGAAGDVLMLTPLIHAMKERWAESSIDVVTDVPEILLNNPEVRRLYHTSNAPNYSYDYVFDLNLAYERDPLMHVSKAYAKVCGVEVEDVRPRFYPKRDDREWARHLMADKWAVIHPGRTAWVGRDWSAAKFEKVAEALRARKLHVALVGDSATPYITSMLDLRGKTTISQLGAIMERAEVFVGIDSLPMHLAQATLVPTVGVFGCIEPKYRLLDAPFIVGVQAKNVGCLGCHHVQAGPRTVNDACLRDRVYCMERLEPEQVIEAAFRAIEERKVYLETSKIREKALPYCVGKGVDLGCGRDKIKPDAIGIDDDPWPEVDKVGNITKLDFADGELDYVYSSHALEDQVDTEAVLEEWSRAIRSGGNIVLYLPHKEHYKGVNLDHKHEFMPEDIAGILESMGHKILVNENDVGDNRYSFLIVSQKP